LFSCSQQDDSSQQTKVDSPPKLTVKIDKENLQELNLSVEGMVCENCENALEKSIGNLPGVAEVEASWKDKKVKVKCDKTKVEKTQITKLIQEKKFKVVQ
jgi:copper chaperone CopZ